MISQLPSVPSFVGVGVVVTTMLFALPIVSYGQGCVAVRGGVCLLPVHGQNPLDNSIAEGNWMASLSYRRLHSDRHFVGDHEQKHRQEQGTEVINDSHFLDLGLSYQWGPRFSTTFTVPMVYSDRSSFYEHSGGSPASGAQRGHSQAGGIGDVRLTSSVWLWDPSEVPKGNIQLGVGIKAPTGDYKSTDTFNTVRGAERHFVDQSIQPGDGGWGLTMEFFGFREVFERTTLYAQGFYLANPRSVNWVSTEIANPRGRSIGALNRTLNSPTATPQQKAIAQSRLDAATALGFNTPTALEDVMSVSDQFLARSGIAYTLDKDWGLSLTLGGRVEGVPVRDLIGDSDGFRRPGYTVSIEPGITIMKGKVAASIFAPVALYRNRQASVADRRWDQIVGGGTSGGDAAFADFVISAGFSYFF